jgi:hypothetical protein
MLSGTGTVCWHSSAVAKLNFWFFLNKTINFKQSDIFLACWANGSLQQSLGHVALSQIGNFIYNEKCATC